MRYLGIDISVNFIHPVVKCLNGRKIRESKRRERGRVGGRDEEEIRREKRYLRVDFFVQFIDSIVEFLNRKRDGRGLDACACKVGDIEIFL